MQRSIDLLLNEYSNIQQLMKTTQFSWKERDEFYKIIKRIQSIFNGFINISEYTQCSKIKAEGNCTYSILFLLQSLLFEYSLDILSIFFKKNEENKRKKSGSIPIISQITENLKTTFFGSNSDVYYKNRYDIFTELFDSLKDCLNIHLYFIVCSTEEREKELQTIQMLEEIVGKKDVDIMYIKSVENQMENIYKVLFSIQQTIQEKYDNLNNNQNEFSFDLMIERFSIEHAAFDKQLNEINRLNEEYLRIEKQKIRKEYEDLKDKLINQFDIEVNKLQNNIPKKYKKLENQINQQSEIINKLNEQQKRNNEEMKHVEESQEMINEINMSMNQIKTNTMIILQKQQTIERQIEEENEYIEIGIEECKENIEVINKKFELLRKQNKMLNKNIDKFREDLITSESLQKFESIQQQLIEQLNDCQKLTKMSIEMNEEDDNTNFMFNAMKHLEENNSMLMKTQKNFDELILLYKNKIQPLLNQNNKTQEELIVNDEIIEIEELNNENEDSEEINTIEQNEIIYIPLQYYCSDKICKIEMNDEQLEIDVNSEFEDRTILKYENCGRTSNNEICPLFLTLYKQKGNYNYQFDGADIHLTLCFESEHFGEKIIYVIILPNEKEETIRLHLIEGYNYISYGNGMIKEDGSFGNLIVTVSLI